MFLKDLTPEEKAVVLAAGCVRLVNPGEMVVAEGENDRSLYVLLTGEMEAVKDLDDKHYRRLMTFKAGDSFGEMACLGVGHRSATVVACAPTELLELTPAGLAQLEKERSDICRKLYWNMATDLAIRLNRTNEELKKSLLVALYGV